MRISSRLFSTAGPLATSLFLLAGRGVAQTAPDLTTSAKAARDSSVAGYGDRATQPGVDTSRGQPADSAAKARADSLANASGAPAVDSVLSEVCTSVRGGVVAPGLLLVLFRDSATDNDRSAAVTEAGGVAAGQAPGGGDYVRVSSDSISSRDLADRLVQDPSIASVSERSCPPDKR
jgi:hypothetical protein